MSEKQTSTTWHIQIKIKTRARGGQTHGTSPGLHARPHAQSPRNFQLGLQVIKSNAALADVRLDECACVCMRVCMCDEHQTARPLFSFPANAAYITCAPCFQ